MLQHLNGAHASPLDSVKRWVETVEGAITLSACGTALLCLLSYKLSRYVSPYIASAYSKFDVFGQRDWDTRYASVIHAVVITCLFFHAWFRTGLYDKDAPWQGIPFVPIAYRSSIETNMSIACSLGYFIIDIGIIGKYYPRVGGPAMLVHHVFALLSLLASLRCQCGQAYVLLLLATEATTPFLIFRWLLEKAGAKNTAAYKANGVFILVTWVAFRVVLFVPFFAHLAAHPLEVASLPLYASAMLVATPILLFCLNLFWFFKICKGVYKHLVRPLIGARDEPGKDE